MTQVCAVAVVLIGGTSHVGKSTVAQALAADLGWRCESTDHLARHPGRPWTAVRPHVHEHYATLSVDELTTQQLAHYQRMWPLVEELVRAEPAGLVLEGSGVWPELAAGLLSGRVAAVWLTAPDAVLRDRIHAESGVDQRSADERLAVRKFVGRTVQYQDRMRAAVDRLGLAMVDVGATTPVAELVARIRRLTGVSAP